MPRGHGEGRTTTTEFGARVLREEVVMPSPPWPWDFEWSELDETARRLAEAQAIVRAKVLANLAVETDPERVAALQMMLEQLDAPNPPRRWWQRRTRD
jgi:hypothetical protein